MHTQTALQGLPRCQPAICAQVRAEHHVQRGSLAWKPRYCSTGRTTLNAELRRTMLAVMQLLRGTWPAACTAPAEGG